VIDAEADDAEELPAAFDATTVKVYEVPALSPDTVIGLEDPVPVKPPGFEVTVNDVAAAPEPAGVNATEAVVCPVEVALTPVGALGCKKDLMLAEALPPRIDISLFYLTLVLLIADLIHI
jgi:hypothetical protein